MKIRQIAPEDIPRLADLYVAVFAGPPWNEVWERQWAVDRLDTICAFPGFSGLVAEDGETPVAAAVGRILPFKGRDEFDLIDFWVDEASQGQGIGTALLSVLETHLRSKGCVFCTLMTARETPAERFYSKQGYRASQRMIFMTKRLVAD